MYPCIFKISGLRSVFVLNGLILKVLYACSKIGSHLIFLRRIGRIYFWKETLYITNVSVGSYRLKTDKLGGG